MLPTKARQPKCYTVAQLLDALQLSRTQFFELKRQGELPFLEELQPRVGGKHRYKAEPIDLYFENKFATTRSSFRKVG